MNPKYIYKIQYNNSEIFKKNLEDSTNQVFVRMEAFGFRDILP